MDSKVATEYLKAEIDTYEKHRAQLVADAEGKYALIHGSDVIGTTTPTRMPSIRVTSSSDWHRSWCSRFEV
ncbi:MAG TPA: hypothetical protein VHB77_09330, partial [Planctomycetaceae bacterium]|nr:hypothetical protein [Planctomycetaceae bacterium]